MTVTGFYLVFKNIWCEFCPVTVTRHFEITLIGVLRGMTQLGFGVRLGLERAVLEDAVMESYQQFVSSILIAEKGRREAALVPSQRQSCQSEHTQRVNNSFDKCVIAPNVVQKRCGPCVLIVCVLWLVIVCL